MERTTLKRLLTRPLLCAATAMAVSLPASADDIDVFAAMANAGAKPNVLFVLDYSGSMGWLVDSDEEGEPSRLTVLKEAMEQLLDSNTGKINAGIGSMYKNKASGVRWPVSDLAADANTIDPEIPAGEFTVAEVIGKQLTRMGSGGSTSTVNALAEAATYFTGGPVLHSDGDLDVPWYHVPDRWDVAAEEYNGDNKYTAMPSSYTPQDAYQRNVFPGNTIGFCQDHDGGTQECDGLTTWDCVYYPPGTSSSSGPDGDTSSSGGGYNQCRYSHPDAWTTPNYVSPITQACQANFMVLISDGRPTSYKDTQTMSEVLASAGVLDGDRSNCEDLGATIFATEEFDKDMGNCGPEILNYLATTDLNPDIPESNVKTFTIGFAVEGPGKDYLELLAQNGQGGFYEATQPAELTDALNAIIDSILAGSQNFAELTIDVDRSTFSHGNKTYFSMYAPSRMSAWQGNLKGFFVDQTGLIDINGNPATINEGSGVMLADASQSFWSSIPDGNELAIGGASESIEEFGEAPNARNLFTNIGGNVLPLDAANRIEVDNTLIDDSYIGGVSAQERADAINWLANAPMGDPLHTKPVVVQYADRSVVYTMTNQGLLHAFDATNPTAPGMTPADNTGGAEIFAFMPKELLQNLPELHKPISGGDHVYGLDGAITRWHIDGTDKNGIVDPGESIYLIFGMRRGGTSYYALDVSNPDYPEFKWQKSSGDSGFEKLAQTWSRPSLISVNDGGTQKQVVMFGGGYDPAVDGNTGPVDNVSGNAVYMVDRAGNQIMKVDPDYMINSIPSDLTIIDTDENGMADRAYFGDLGGNMWRLDFEDTDNYTLTKLANVQDAHHQPIFYAPSVTRTTDAGKRFLAIAFGTGDRTQPLLETSNNRFYMIRDVDYKTGPPTSGLNTTTYDMLYDATDNDLGSPVDQTREDAEQEFALPEKRGWLVRLLPGEKSLSKVVTFQGKFMATTFEPDPQTDDLGNVDVCSFSSLGRLYVMSLTDAQPINILADGSETSENLTAANRITDLGSLSIPSSPVLIFPADSSQVQVMVDKESIDLVNQNVTTVFWHAK